MKYFYRTTKKMRDRRLISSIIGGVWNPNIKRNDAIAILNDITQAWNNRDHKSVNRIVQYVNPDWDLSGKDNKAYSSRVSDIKKHLNRIIEQEPEPYEVAPRTPIIEAAEPEIPEVEELERKTYIPSAYEEPAFYDPLLNPPPKELEPVPELLFMPRIKDEFDEIFKEAGLKNIKLDKLYKEPLTMPGATELKNLKVEKYFDKRGFRDAFIAKLKEIKRDTKSVAKQKELIKRELKDISLNVPDEIREAVAKMYKDASETKMEETQPFVPPPKEEIQQLATKTMRDNARALFKDIKTTPERFLPQEMLPIKRYIADKKLKKYTDLPADMQNKFIELTLMPPEERKAALETITEAPIALPTPIVGPPEEPPKLPKSKGPKSPGKLQKELAKDPITVSLVVRKKKKTHKCKLAPKIAALAH